MSNSNKDWNQQKPNYENKLKIKQIEKNQNHWINSITKHKHHHSLDSSLKTTYNSNQQQPQQLTNQQQQQLLSIIPFNRRSSSLSIDQNNSSSSTSINYPTDGQSSTSSTIDLDYHQTNKPQIKRTQTKLSLVTAIPASILKKDKPGLLSQEQKRANHIASEQKRRAAIRQGYSRLCLIVPSLRATLGGGEDQSGGTTPQSNLQTTLIPKKSDDDYAFDDQTNLLNSTINLDRDDSHSSTTNIHNFKRKRDKQLAFESNRPPPRSEAVVLAKTVEYLRELESERNIFLEKLQSLRMIAISKGIQISKSNRYQQGEHNQLNQKENNDDLLDDRNDPNSENLIEKENRLEVWEDKWYGNIHQIDLKLNNLNHPLDLKGDHHNLHIIDFNIQSNLHHLSPPTSSTINSNHFIHDASVY